MPSRRSRHFTGCSSDLRLRKPRGAASPRYEDHTPIHIRWCRSGKGIFGWAGGDTEVAVCFETMEVGVPLTRSSMRNDLGSVGGVTPRSSHFSLRIPESMKAHGSMLPTSPSLRMTTRTPIFYIESSPHCTATLAERHFPWNGATLVTALNPHHQTHIPDSHILWAIH